MAWETPRIGGIWRKSLGKAAKSKICLCNWCKLLTDALEVKFQDQVEVGGICSDFRIYRNMFGVDVLNNMKMNQIIYYEWTYL